MPFSPRQQYAGQTVLLTGSLGFLGSVVLEQLLRLTDVARCYLLVRGKRQSTAAKRVEDLLRSPLFHLLHKESAAGKRNVFGKVVALEGDLTRPQLGLSAEDLQALRQEVGIVLHCGANIQLDADIQLTLRNNYLGTLELLQTVSQFSNLRAFVHVSTFFVNNNLPRNSLVEERIYELPLSIDGVPMSHKDYVSAILAMEPKQANKHATVLLRELNFSSTYAFGKHLTEQLVSGTCIKQGVSKAIVRPSLITSVAYDPYPGYISSYAGAAGCTMGYALGFFQSPRSIAYASDAVMDLIPADVVAALVIAAGAAAAATWGSSGAGSGAVIYHATSSDSNPLTVSYCFEQMRQFWKTNSPPLCLPLTTYVLMPGQHSPTQQDIDRCAAAAELKVKLTGSLLKLAGKHRECKALRMGFKAFRVLNSLPYCKSFRCSVANASALWAQMSADEQQQWPLVWDECNAMSWDLYGHTFMAGVRCLLFKVKKPSAKVEHMFKHIPEASADNLRLWRTSGTDSCSSSSSCHDGGVAAAVNAPDKVQVEARLQAATGMAGPQSREGCCFSGRKACCYNIGGASGPRP